MSRNEPVFKLRARVLRICQSWIWVSTFILPCATLTKSFNHSASVSLLIKYGWRLIITIANTSGKIIIIPSPKGCNNSYLTNIPPSFSVCLAPEIRQKTHARSQEGRETANKQVKQNAVIHWDKCSKNCAEVENRGVQDGVGSGTPGMGVNTQNVPGS